jgi:hypothetical protein
MRDYDKTPQNDLHIGDESLPVIARAFPTNPEFCGASIHGQKPVKPIEIMWDETGRVVVRNNGEDVVRFPPQMVRAVVPVHPPRRMTINTPFGSATIDWPTLCCPGDVIRRIAEDAEMMNALAHPYPEDIMLYFGQPTKDATPPPTSPSAS